MNPRTALLLLAVGASVRAGAGQSVLHLPRAPAHLLVDGATTAVLSQAAIRGQLHEYLPPGTVLVQDLNAPANNALQEDTDLHRGEPHPVAARIGVHPAIDFADNRYSLVRSDQIPLLVDWFEALGASLGCTPAQMRDAGFRCNKVARLMRVFVSIRLRRTNDGDRGAAPAIGWCRVLLQEDWGRCRRGETHTFVLVGTEQGWSVVDPFARRQRMLEPDDRRWILEFVVL